MDEIRKRSRRLIRYLAGAAVLNAPFALCHPGGLFRDGPLLDVAPLRSLAIAAVLFLLPGVPLVGAMIGRGWLRRFELLPAMAASLAVFVTALAAVHIAGVSLEGAIAWNVTWGLTNLALLLNVVLGGPATWGLSPRDTNWQIAVPLFAAAYAAFFYAATQVVPPMQDQDCDIQGPGYALLTRFEPEVVNDRKLLHYFAHPLLLNYYVGGSFLYHGELDYLARFEAATDRVRRAEAGEAIEPVVAEFDRFPDTRVARPAGDPEPGAKRHEIVGVRGGNYRIHPALPAYEGRHDVAELPVRELEVLILWDDYECDPRRLETRTPNVFLSALTVAILGTWIRRCGGRWWLALLVPVVYATSPEVFVRSSYGGYFAISMFALVQMLQAIERWAGERRVGDCRIAARGHCLLAGAFAAVVNNKLVLLPAAVGLWQFVRLSDERVTKRFARAAGHPVVLGFGAATAAFCLYGLAISPGDFLSDAVRIHLVDRITHHHPFGFGNYPSVPGLWLEFWQHTGYVLLPLGLTALGALCVRRDAAHDSIHAATGESRLPGLYSTAGLWAVWAVAVAVAFSLIDWRQTKHLMPLMLPLLLGPVRWVLPQPAKCGGSRGATEQESKRRTSHAAPPHTPPLPRSLAPPLLVLLVLMTGLLLWNLGTLGHLLDDFHAFTVTPDW